MSAVWRPDVNPENGVFRELEEYWTCLFSAAQMECLYEDIDTAEISNAFKFEILDKVWRQFSDEVLFETSEFLRDLSRDQLVFSQTSIAVDYRNHLPSHRKQVLKQILHHELKNHEGMQKVPEAFFENAMDSYSRAYLQVKNEINNRFIDSGFRGLTLEDEVKGVRSVKRGTPNSSVNNIQQYLTEKGEKNWQNLLQLLRSSKPPSLDADGHWIGKPKGIICVWFDVIRSEGFIKSPKSNQELAEALNREFLGLDINPTMFGKSHETAENKFKEDFQRSVKQIS